MKGGQCGLIGGKRSRRMRGGMYGFSGEAVAPGTLVAGAPYTGPVNAAGAAVPDPTDPAGGYVGLGGRRRRKSRKGSKKSRKGTRKMKGGSAQVSAMKAGYGFTGAGSAGLADATPAPTSGGNAF
jgi:hypothetical protein